MSAEKFIKRSLEAIENLIFFEKQDYIQPNFYKFIKVLSVYNKLKKLKLAGLYLFYYTLNKDKWITNLKSENPNLRNLDKLKLGRLIELKSI